MCSDRTWHPCPGVYLLRLQMKAKVYSDSLLQHESSANVSGMSTLQGESSMADMRPEARGRRGDIYF